MQEHRLKGLLNPEHIWQVDAPDLPQAFPPLESLNAIPNNLPLQLTSFVGRERELAEIKQLLLTTHLLTLTGSGGTGKTRLSLQTAADVLESFADGVWFVELAPIADPALVPQTVATALGIRELPGHSIQDLLVDYLRGKRLLLILDNCEHLIDACAQFANQLLRACPNLKILASSREALGIAGEHAYRVPSLSIAELRQTPALDAIRHNDCVQLFVERALAAQATFHLTEKNARAIAQICLRLDGIPLAVELAAARAKVFTPEQIAARLDDRFRLLTGGSRTALPRQQTLRALIDWSYDLLPEAERILLRRLSVFVNGWTYEAAEQVCSDQSSMDSNQSLTGHRLLMTDILDLLTHLVDKSLVVVDESDEANARYRLLETIRQYARDKLLDSGEVGAVRDRHLAYFVHFGDEAYTDLLSAREVEWRPRVRVEQDNVRAAVEWGLDNQPEAALRLSGELSVYLARMGYAREGCRWLEAGLERVAVLSPVEGEAARERQFHRALGLLGMGSGMMTLGKVAAAKRYAEESLPLWRELGRQREQGYALMTIGTSTQFLGDAPTALAAMREGLAVARTIGDPWLLAYALGAEAMTILTLERDIATARSNLEESIRIFHSLGDDQSAAFSYWVLGELEYVSGNYVQARAAFEPSLAGHLAAGNLQDANMARSGLANAEWRLGHYDAALMLYRQVIADWQWIGNRGGIARCLECVAFVFVHLAENEIARQAWLPRAARLLGAAEKLRETINAVMMPHEQSEYVQEIARLHERLDETTLKAAWAEGRALTMEQAIALTLNENESSENES
jgi:predicted ATPase